MLLSSFYPLHADFRVSSCSLLRKIFQFSEGYFLVDYGTWILRKIPAVCSLPHFSNKYVLYWVKPENLLCRMLLCRMLLCRMHTNNVDTHNFGKNLNYECAIKCALHRDFGIGKIPISGFRLTHSLGAGYEISIMRDSLPHTAYRC